MTEVVSYELAKLLKEKGFDKPTKQRYFIAENIDSDRFPVLQEECTLHNWNDYDDSSTTYYSAPTIATLIDWLYKNHSLWITIVPMRFGGFISRIYKKVNYTIIDPQTNIEWVVKSDYVKGLPEYEEDLYETKEEAYFKAISYVLKELI